MERRILLCYPITEVQRMLHSRKQFDIFYGSLEISSVDENNFKLYETFSSSAADGSIVNYFYSFSGDRCSYLLKLRKHSDSETIVSLNLLEIDADGVALWYLLAIPGLLFLLPWVDLGIPQFLKGFLYAISLIFIFRRLILAGIKVSSIFSLLAREFGINLRSIRYFIG
jgi:hypothetical protein